MDISNFDDGICDDDLNVAWYNFDNGDCCENNTASRLVCDECLCNVTMMEILRKQNGFACHIKGVAQKEHGFSANEKPSNGICNLSKSNEFK